MTETAAWHFTSDTLRDGQPIPPVGQWLVHEGPIRICATGLHASARLIDALSHAPGNRLHRVTMRGVADRQSDKMVARERRIDWSIDAEPVLRAFARRCALDVLPLWPDAPEIVRRYLETGDESIRDAAKAAACAAAWDAAVDAAADAAVDAAGAAAVDAAGAAAWGAAVDAAGAAAVDAAGAAAWYANLSKYNDWLTEMVEAAKMETA